MARFWKRVWSDAFPAVWLPLYVLLGTAWLLAPVLAHEHYGTLRLISSEEAGGPGAWFRLTDIIAGVLLVSAVVRFGLLRKVRYVGWAIIVIGALSVVDGLFPDACYIGHETCSTTASMLSVVHDMETVILVGVVAALSVFDTFKRRRLASYGFVGLQLVAAVLVISGLASQQFRVVLQYVYAFSSIAWLAWFVDGFNSFRPDKRYARTVRRVAGIWVLLAGVATLVVALLPHLEFVSREVVQRLARNGFHGEQHAIIAGILMLYVSRHILRGECPALWLVLAVVAWQLMHYGLATPIGYAVVFYSVMFAALLYVRASFDRNVVQPSWASRFKDIATVFGGVLGALILVFAVEAATGHGARFSQDVANMFDYSHQAIENREAHLHERTEARLRLSFETLVISLGVITIWSLFRPRSLAGVESGHDVDTMRDLLNRYSLNSEDYFKLWPTEQKRYFSVSGVAGMIAYRVQGSVAFMMADPIAATKPSRAKLLNEFKIFARQHGWVICALLVPDMSRSLYEKAGMRTMQIGSSAVISVEDFQAQTARDKWWRWQRNRARKAGWEYEALQPPHSPEIMANLRKVSDAWLTREGHQEEGFALGYFDEGYLQECVIHVLRDETGEILAFANQMPTFGTVQQATVDLIRFQPDMNGAMPAVLLHIIENLDPAKHKTFDLGFVPLARMDSNLAQIARRLGSRRFASGGLEQFKNKFKPDWQANYVAYDGDLIDLARVATNLEKLFAVDPNQLKK